MNLEAFRRAYYYSVSAQEIRLTGDEIENTVELANDINRWHIPFFDVFNRVTWSINEIS